MKRKPLFEFRFSIEEEDNNAEDEKIDKMKVETKDECIRKISTSSSYDAITLGLSFDELF